MTRVRLMVMMAVCLLCMPIAHAGAKVVISELLWSGSDLSTADEWIELTNTGTGAVSLSGWVLTRLSSGNESPMLTFPAGATIGPQQFFVISNYDEGNSRLSIEPEVIDTAVSLTNTQLFLWLYDSSGTLIDTVDDGIGAPFAGSNTEPKASMEKIDLMGSGQTKTNWKTAVTFLHFDDGAPLLGTPGAENGTGPSIDIFPPKEATNFAAEIEVGSSSGTISVTWTPSTSLDLRSQILEWNGTGVTLSHTATGITLPEIGTGVLFTLRSMDHLGNLSTGITTVSRPFPNVKITEVLANPTGADDLEWIEVANLGTEVVDIGGWILDEGNSPENFTFPSPFLLQPNEHHALTKTVTNLPLGNEWEVLMLKRGSTVIDTWAYSETAEEVSIGRRNDDPSLFAAFCVPTMNMPNDAIEQNPIIEVQSGNLEDERSVTLNLQVAVQTGSLAHAVCHFDYSDGYTSDSCNPPSHTFDAVGTYEIHLTYSNFCHQEITRSIVASVTEPAASTSPQRVSGQSSGTSGAGNSKESGNRTSCIPAEFDGIRISEFLPNPEGDDADLEWIELENTLSATASLCGWNIDDGEEGSKPFILDAFTIAPQSFLLLKRTQTKIALNNSDESVRLFDPNGETEQSVSYGTSEDGESFALREDGLFVWTPLLTPGSANAFRTAERSGTTQTVIISAVLPNPDGKDEGNEWIELTNIGAGPIDLFGWSLTNAKGNSYVIPKMKLRSKEVHRFTSDRTNITLTNAKDEARLYDAFANLVSLLGWSDAISGRTYFPSQAGERMTAEVVNVVDGDTIDMMIDGKRERVRMIGVDTPETVHPKKSVEKFGKEASAFTKKILLGKTISLEFGDEEQDKYGRMLAYVILMDGTNFNGELVRRGLAYAYLRFPFAYSALFQAYEEEARKSKLGLWADEEIEAEVNIAKEMIEVEVMREHMIITGSGASASGGTLTGAALMIDDESIETLPAISLEENPFSEVMSNPPKEGALHDLGEYIELVNAMDERISLDGWILDDDPQGSSKKKTLDERYVIEPHGYLLLCNSEECDLPLGISLNNEGEVLSLTSPDSTQMFSITYPRMERGASYALVKNEWCRTDSITPRAPNICTPSENISKNISMRQSSKTSKSYIVNEASVMKGLKNKYRNIVVSTEDANEIKAIHPMLAALQMKAKNDALTIRIPESQAAKRHLSAVTSALSFLALGTALARRKAHSSSPQKDSVPV